MQVGAAVLHDSRPAVVAYVEEAAGTADLIYDDGDEADDVPLAALTLPSPNANPAGPFAAGAATRHGPRAAVVASVDAAAGTADLIYEDTGEEADGVPLAELKPPAAAAPAPQDTDAALLASCDRSLLLLALADAAAGCLVGHKASKPRCLLVPCAGAPAATEALVVASRARPLVVSPPGAGLGLELVLCAPDAAARAALEAQPAVAAAPDTRVVVVGEGVGHPTLRPKKRKRPAVVVAVPAWDAHAAAAVALALAQPSALVVVAGAPPAQELAVLLQTAELTLLGSSPEADPDGCARAAVAHAAAGLAPGAARLLPAAVRHMATAHMTIDALFAVLRLLRFSPVAVGALAPLLVRRAHYLRLTGHEARLDTVHALLAAGDLAAWGLPAAVPVVDAQGDGDKRVPAGAQGRSFHWTAAWLLWLLDANEEAAALLRDVARRRGGALDAHSWFLLGLALEACGRAAEAADAYREAVATDDDLQPAREAYRRLAAGAGAPPPAPAIDVQPASTLPAGLEDPDLPADVRCVERRVRLSRSFMWDAHMQFYDEAGQDAWTAAQGDTIPYSVTSNAFIADGYARMVHAFVADLAAAGQLSADEPVYVIELGAGHGKFSALFVRALARLAATHGMAARVCLVVTDFTEANVSAMQALDSLQHQPDDPVLVDFAIFNCEADTQLQLRRSGVVLCPATPTANPVVLVANYLVDSLRADAFRVSRSQRLCEGLVSSYAPAGPEPHPRLDRVQHGWAYEELPAHVQYYGWAEVDEMLEAYRSELPPGATFLLPIGGLRCVHSLLRLADGERALMLLGDKFTARPELFARWDDPYVAKHGRGVISLTVNGDAVARLFRRRGAPGGAALVATTPHCGASVDVGVFSTLAAAQLPRLRHAFAVSLQRFSPHDYTGVAELARAMPDLPLDAQLALLRVGQGDPEVFPTLRLQAAVRGAQPAQLDAVARALQQVWANHIPAFDQGGHEQRAKDQLSDAMFWAGRAARSSLGSPSLVVEC